MLQKNPAGGLFMISIPTIYMGILAARVYHLVKVYIIEIELGSDSLIITYQLKDRELTRQIPLDDLLYRTRVYDRAGNEIIHFLQNEKTVLKQYAFDAWKNQEIDAIDEQLKLNGVKKPYGENL